MERTDFEQWKAREVARLLALVETERRYYQEMVASLPVALVVLSAERSIVSANRAFRQAFGRRREDLRRLTIDQILPSPELIEKIRDAHVHGGPQADVFLEVEQRSLRIAIMPIRNWDDELETLLMVEDLTSLDAVRRGAPHPVTAPCIAFADVPAILWQADDVTLTFTAVSGATEPLLGYPVSHWLETPGIFSERIHSEDRAATMAFYEAAIARAGDASAEFRAITASGGFIWCRETIRVPAPGGGKRLISGVITDISRRKQLERQMLTAERTDALHGMASRLAHDLNNPLMIITGYGEELLRGLEPQNPLRGDVEQILSATERISGLTGQLLDFTRRVANPLRPVNVNGILAGLEKKIAKDAGESVTVERIEAGDPVWALADPAQLEEVILAMVSSGREGAQESSYLTIGCEIDTIAEQLPASTLRPGVYSRIVMHDGRREMNAAQCVAVLEAVLSRPYSMVREWGGDIAVSSEPARGSTFVVYLPHCEPQVAEPVASHTSEVVEAPKTILLVEDEAGIRALVRKILRRENYNVIEAGNAEEALQLSATRRETIHLLLTDVMLPGAGGRHLAERMGQTLPDLRVLYVSGYADDEAVRTGAFPPGSKFLQKPFTLAALVGKVREALE